MYSRCLQSGKICVGSRSPSRVFQLIGILSVALYLSAGVFSPVYAQGENFAIEQLEADKWSGDFDGMVERHTIRALVSYSKTFYFLDGPTQHGLSYEGLKQFEKKINEDLKKKTVKVEVVFIPVVRDKLIPELVSGRGDLAVANLTITPERRKLVDFSDPLYKGVSEVVVTGPNSPAVSSVDDLAGQTIHVRKSSSYYESLLAQNEKFRQTGKPEIKLETVEEFLEDEDLLEMVSAGLLPMIVMDSHKAKFWAQVFPDIKVHADVTLRTGGEIAWAFRKGSPKLKEVVNAFVKKNKKGTLMGNMLFNRYLKSIKHVKNSLKAEDMKRFRDAIKFLKKYSEQYEFDYLIIGALAYQESQIDQSKRSHVGAVGVMQILPSTASDKNVDIDNIGELESNIHAGVKYLHFIHHRYFKDPAVDEFNQWLFTFAAYNAGPAKVAKLRKEATKMGLDPNVWFRNVELVAAKRIGRETVQYVSNIYKYYVAYSLIVETLDKRKAAMESG